MRGDFPGEAVISRKRFIKRPIAGTALVTIAVIFGSFCASRLEEPPDGRRYAFIDGGAHMGESIAKFEKSNLYRKHRWEMFSFEANPNLIAFIPRKPNLTILNKAIWTSDGTLEFYLATNTESSSILKNKKSGELNHTPIIVESVDFGQWLKANFEIKDYLFIRLDIEGAEYEVLNKMLGEGTIEYVDRLSLEFHNARVGVSVERDKEIIAKIKKLGIPVKVAN